MKAALVCFAPLLLFLSNVQPNDGCLLTCDLSQPNACKNIQVRVQQSEVLIRFDWNFAKNLLFPIQNGVHTWMLDGEGISEVGQDLTPSCFKLTPGVQQSEVNGIRAVNLEGNNITSLPDKLTSIFADPYTDISFSHNYVSEVPLNFLANFTQDTLSLNLGYNLLTSIDKITAGYAGSILNISLQSNQLKDLSNYTFDDFEGNDLIVDMSGNSGGEIVIPSLFLAGYSGVRLSVRMEDNNIKSVPEDLIANFKGESLYLYLNNNQITSLGPGFFVITQVGQHIFAFMENNSIAELDDCLFKQFVGKGLNVYFQYNQITSIPKNLFNNPDCNSFQEFQPTEFRLDLSNNQIDSLGSSPFEWITEAVVVMHLDLNSNYIQTIPTGFFNGFNGGELLIDMSNNIINGTSPDIFLAFTASSLALNLTNNSMTSLPTLQNLRVSTLTLILDSNDIQDVGVGFAGFDSAVNANISIRNSKMTTSNFQTLMQSYSFGSGQVYFFLSNNSIGQLPDEILKAPLSDTGHAAGALTLTLDNNNITSIGAASLFDYPGFSVTIDLSHNPIRSYPKNFNITTNGFVSKRARIFNLQQLTLNLSHTNIDVDILASFDLFKGTDFSIDLSYNGITNVSPLAAQALNAAFEITTCSVYLNNNLIAALPNESFLTATVLDLSNNSLTSIIPQQFARNDRSQLETILLRNNFITEISKDTFGRSTRLHKLDLSNNYISVITTYILEQTPNLIECKMANNKIISLPIRNRIFQRSDFENNPLQCDKYWPSPENCSCSKFADRPYYVSFCQYAMCIPSPTLCPGTDSLLASTCTDAPNFKCKTGCGNESFLSFEPQKNNFDGGQCGSMPTSTSANKSNIGLCVPLTVCNGSFGNIQAYEYKAPTNISNRVCAPCSTCPTGYHKSPCTLTSDSACSMISRTGEVAAIVMGVLLAFFATTALLFVWGRQHKESKIAVTSTLHRTTQDLEMTERLLEDEEAKAQAHEESWKAHWDDVAIREVLGEGTFGLVHMGEWLGTRVAVKILKKPMLQNDESDAFRSEMQTMQKLHHPHLVSFFGYGITSAGLPFLLTELMRGTLRDFLSEHSTSPWQVRRRFLADIASGMLFLHTRDPPMIHRDLKSDNCLIGDNDIIKIADFGTVTRPSATVGGVTTNSFSKSPKGEDSDTTSSSWLTTSGVSNASTWFTMTATLGAGTPLWMAPEVLNGKHGSAKYGSPCDVYSFGICMWEIATGKMPYQGQDISKIGSQFAFSDYVQAGGRPEIPKDSNPIPNDYIGLMNICWHSDPTQRPTFNVIGTAISKLQL